MKFATILREAGFSKKEFKKVSEISVILYDEKDRVVESDDIRFVNKLFKNNTKSFVKFYDLLKNLENRSKQPISINIQINENSIVVFYKTANPKIFLRN